MYVCVLMCDTLGTEDRVNIIPHHRIGLQIAFAPQKYHPNIVECVLYGPE